METNNISEVFTAEQKEGYLNSTIVLDWTDPRLKTITRLRLLSDPSFPFWDVSYCYGLTQADEPCRVRVPFFQIPKHDVMGYIYRCARRDGVFANGLNIRDAISRCQ